MNEFTWKKKEYLNVTIWYMVNPIGKVMGNSIFKDKNSSMFFSSGKIFLSLNDAQLFTKKKILQQIKSEIDKNE